MLKAINKMCIVEQVEQEKTTSSGLILTHSLDGPPKVIIRSAGPDATAVKEGDRCVIDWRNVQQLTTTEPKQYIVHQDFIMAIDV